MIRAILKHEKTGRIFGTKNVPEDCLAIKWGGSIFVARDPERKDPGTMTFIRTDTYVFNDLDSEGQP